MNPQLRTALTHIGTALGGAIAAIGFVSWHGIDVYALVDRLNTVVANTTRLVALVMPLATAAYGVYKSSIKQKLIDIVASPEAPKIAASMPVTAQTVAIAAAFEKQV